MCQASAPLGRIILIYAGCSLKVLELESKKWLTAERIFTPRSNDSFESRVLRQVSIEKLPRPFHLTAFCHAVASVMSAWIADIQARRMCLDTSMSTWVPAVHAGTTSSHCNVT